MSITTQRPTRIQPFWERLRAISLYPFRGEALLMLVVVSLGQLLTAIPVLGFFIWLLLVAMAYKYAFTILRRTAHGELDPPSGALDAPDSVVVKFLFLQILMLLGAVLVAIFLGLVPGLIAVLAVTLALPAATISLAMDESLGSALNPATWLSIAGRLGGAYLLLFALLLVFQFSAANASGLAGRFLPWPLGEIALTAIFTWGLFATFHLMGYLVYQYHERFGLEPEAHVRQAMRPQSRDTELLAASEDLLREGRSEEAMRLLGEEVNSRAVPLEAHERYRKLLRQHGLPAQRHQHGAMLLNILCLEGEYRRAIGLARELLDEDPDFAPLLPEQGLDLAQRAHLSGQGQVAVDLLARMRRRFPKQRERVDWALMEADLILRRNGDVGQAREALEGALDRAVGDEQRRRLEAMLATLPA